MPGCAGGFTRAAGEDNGFYIDFQLEPLAAARVRNLLQGPKPAAGLQGKKHKISLSLREEKNIIDVIFSKEKNIQKTLFSLGKK